MKTITLITPGNTEETQKTRRRLKSWNIPFNEMENAYDNETHMMIKNNGKTSCYNWKSFSTRDKLWELVKKEREEQTKHKLRIKKITKSHSTGINLSLESLARINVTIARILGGQNINDIVNEWPEEERAAGMIMWRLAQHSNAGNLLTFAEMLENKAKTIDPWRK